MSSSIHILADENKNLVLFPNGSGNGFTAYFPIELPYPYTAEELAKKIEYALGECGKHESYPDFSGKNTFEEKYYGIKGFKNAVKGKRQISILMLITDVVSKYHISIALPLKRGYGYLGIESFSINETSTCLDYAEKIIDWLGKDLTEFRNFKIFKDKLLF